MSLIKLAASPASLGRLAKVINKGVVALESIGGNGHALGTFLSHHNTARHAKNLADHLTHPQSAKNIRNLMAGKKEAFKEFSRAAGTKDKLLYSINPDTGDHISRVIGQEPLMKPSITSKAMAPFMPSILANARKIIGK